MFYAQDNESSELSLSGCEVSEGDLVALPWTANMWYRGRVMGVKDLTTLRVFYLDYGSVADVKRSSARLLLPALAGGRKWASASTGRLSQLSHMMGLQAIIMGREGGKLAVWLIDKEVLGINETLVDMMKALQDTGADIIPKNLETWTMRRSSWRRR